MKSKLLLLRCCIAILLLTLFSTNGFSTNSYAKLTAKIEATKNAKGKGRVYVTLDSQKTPGNNDWKVDKSEIKTSEVKMSSLQTFYAHAKEITGYSIEWKDGNNTSTINPYTTQKAAHRDWAQTAEYEITLEYTPNQYQITLDLDGGTYVEQPIADNKVTVTYDAVPNLPSVKKDGYSFSRWTNNGVNFDTSADYTIAGGITLKANWTANTYTVTFNANGGTVSPASTNVTFNTTYGDRLPVPYYAYHHFVGWYTAAEEGEQVTSESKFLTPNNDLVLYAHWSEEHNYVNGVCTVCNHLDATKAASFSEAGAFLYTNIDGKQVALGIGADWNTRATLDNENVQQVNISTNAEKLTTVYFPNATTTNKYLFDAASYNLYTDGATDNLFYFMPQGNDGYKIFIPNDTYWAIGHKPDGPNGEVVMKLVHHAEADVFYLGDTQVKMSVSGTAGYGTLVTPFSVELPDEVTAFNATDKGTYVSLSARASQTLPANTPVILKNDTETGTTVTQTYYGNSTATGNTATNGCLVGVYSRTLADVGTYLLQYQNNETAFFPVLQGSELYVGANRAYMVAGAQAPVKAISFDTDAINEVSVEEKDIVFDLSGRKLSSKPNKGLYILNGKKYMVK